MSILSTSLYGVSSSSNRISGLSSGIDTDTLVEQMATGTKNKINRAYQAKQKLLYKQEAYREISSKLVSFSDKYLSFSSESNTNILSKNFFESYTIEPSSKYVNVSGDNENIKNFKIIDVSSVATSASFTSTNSISNQTIKSGEITSFTASNSTMTFDLNGVKKTIILDGEITDAVSLKDKLQTQLNKAFGDGKITVSADGDKVNFIASGTDIFGITDISDDISSSIGIEEGTYNRLSKTTAIGSNGLLSTPLVGDSYKIEVNGKEFTFDSTSTVNDIISKINDDADADVTMYYSSVTDKITVKSDSTGSNSDVVIKDVIGNGNLAESLFGSSDINAENGKDTIMTYTLNGVDAITVSRSTLNFTIDSISVSLDGRAKDSIKLSDPSTTATFSVIKNTDDIVKNAKQFIDDYNEIIELISKKTSERPDNNYQPLTPEQQDEMEKDDIDKWDEQAKKGMLYGDRKIDGILRNLRNVMSNKTSVSSLTLSSVGIAAEKFDTSGKLKFDEEIFKTKLNENPDKIMNLFIKSSTEENGVSGIAKQVQSILQANIGSFGGSGILIREAGLEDGLTADKNNLSESMKEYDKRMAKLKVSLADEKERYYKKFTALEKALNSLNAQSSWLMSMLGQ